MRRVLALIMAAIGGGMIVAATFPMEPQPLIILVVLGATLAWIGIKGYDSA